MGPEAHPKNTQGTSACLTDGEVDIGTIWGCSLDGGQFLGPYDSHSSILGKEPLQGGAAKVGTWKREVPDEV